MEREALREKMNQIEFPNASGIIGNTKKTPPILKKQYSKILDTLNIQSKDDLLMLRTLVSERIGEEQDKLRKETMDRIMSGSLSMDDPAGIPLCRQEDGRMAIPKGGMLNAICFIMYLNETIEWKYPGAKMSANEAVYTMYREAEEHYALLPGSSYMAVVKTDDFFRVITSKEPADMVMMLIVAMTDFAKSYAKEKTPSMSAAESFEKVVFPMLYDGIEKAVETVKDEEVLLIDVEDVVGKRLKSMGVHKMSYEEAAEIAKQLPKNRIDEIISKTHNMVEDVIIGSELSEKQYEFLSLCDFYNESSVHGELKDMSTLRRLIAAVLKADKKEFGPNLPGDLYYKETGRVMKKGVLETLEELS